PQLEDMDLGLAKETAELLLDPIRREEEPLMLIDLGSMEFIGSSFLALLLRCWKAVQAGGGQLALVGVSDRARELLRITGLDTLLPIYGGRQQALEALLSD